MTFNLRGSVLPDTMAAVRTATFSLVVAALIAFAAAPAQAQDAEKARQLFQQGSKYYDLGQFDKAIEAWQQATTRSPIRGFSTTSPRRTGRSRTPPRRSSSTRVTCGTRRRRTT